MPENNKKTDYKTLHKDFIQEDMELQEAIKHLKRNNSLSYTFLKGFVYGFATVVGGTIFITTLIWTLTRLQIIPYFGDIAAIALKFIENQNH
ncbi:MAG: hypothetical protein E6Q58_05385 [Niabella sp.]|nr:MAG: hypothetical protein E6Q58_05385 [Niabella sp.]